ncbi:MAG: SgcJ/EcaC family oxidoreductase [Bacteroidales bacterium]
MRRTVTFALAIVVAGSTLNAQTRRGQANDETAIRQLPQKYESAWNSRNMQQIADMYTVDAVEVEPSGQVLKGRSAIEANLREGFKNMANASLSLQTDEVRFIGPNAAVVTGKSTIQGLPASGGPGEGHWMVVAKKAGSEWKVSEAHLASVVAGPRPESVGTSGRSAAAETDLNDIETRWLKATVDGDASFLERIYADNYTFVNPMGQLMTREQDINDVKSGNLKFTSAEPSNVQTRVFGDAAIVTGIVTINGTYGGENISGRYRWTDTFVRQNGQWKVAASQVNRIAEQQER